MVVKGGGIGVQTGAHDDVALVSHAVQVGSDEASADVRRGDQLDVALGVAERTRREVGDVPVVAAVGRPIEDDLGFPGDENPHISR